MHEHQNSQPADRANRRRATVITLEQHALAFTRPVITTSSKRSMPIMLAIISRHYVITIMGQDAARSLVTRSHRGTQYERACVRAYSRRHRDSIGLRNGSRTSPLSLSLSLSGCQPLASVSRSIRVGCLLSRPRLSREINHRLSCPLFNQARD